MKEKNKERKWLSTKEIIDIYKINKNIFNRKFRDKYTEKEIKYGKNRRDGNLYDWKKTQEIALQLNQENISTEQIKDQITELKPIIQKKLGLKKSSINNIPDVIFAELINLDNQLTQLQYAYDALKKSVIVKSTSNPFTGAKSFQITNPDAFKEFTNEIPKYFK